MKRGGDRVHKLLRENTSTGATATLVYLRLKWGFPFCACLTIQNYFYVCKTVQLLGDLTCFIKWLMSIKCTPFEILTWYNRSHKMQQLNCSNFKSVLIKIILCLSVLNLYFSRHNLQNFYKFLSLLVKICWSRRLPDHW